jgi:hypothetical protein
MSRTTLDLDDMVLLAARSVVEDSVRTNGRRMSLGEAVSALALSGLEARQPASHPDGFPVLDVYVPGHLVTDELVKRYQDD